MKYYFKHNFHFNASHSFDNKIENAHEHTFELVLYIEDRRPQEFLSYQVIDELVEHYLKGYSKAYLNEMPVFKGILPTVENIGEKFYEDLYRLLTKKQLKLLQLTIGETPVRVYIISNCILIPSYYGGNAKKNWAELLDKKEKLMHLGGERSDRV